MDSYKTLKFVLKPIFKILYRPTIINKEKIIQGDFPIEAINLIPNLNVKKIISVSSTATKSIANCSESIVLGWDYLEGYKDHE